MEFKEYYLGELCEIKSSKRIYAKDYVNKGIPFYRSKEIIEKSKGLDISQNLYIDNKKFEEIEEKHGIPETGDLLLTSVGTLGVPYIVKNEKFYFKDGNLTWFTNFKSLLNQYYLFYWFKSKEGIGEINRVTIGSTQKALTIKNLRYLKITLPDKKNQFKIINLIQKIENKLENNKQVIANLEELSQTLFKRWFVDFEFPDENGNPYKSNGGEMVDSELGAIPKGWNVKNLDDIANYMNGLAMQKFKPTDNQNSLPVVKIKELKNGSTDENSNRCTSEIPEKALIVDGDIIFSWSATLLVKMWCGGKAGLNQHLFKVSSDKYPKWFYYYWTKRYIDYFIGIANDKATTMGHINRKHLSHAKILTPNDQTLEKFSRTFDDLLEKELSVSKESKRLTELRDTLLPKLMSGEIEIPTDIEVNEDELSI
ncbi:MULTISPECIES: restriction endonuclease subunit S [unclassified Staphylococcus]|uniref:restriction endonuclease subunit S n=1 Tax=unclassified Staphylococcus TaxID=91994 RepID=UPI001AEBB522|nr:MULTISPECIES: restriction endonuclease subunit S [unclassified Staphylococcus]